MQKEKKALPNLFVHLLLLVLVCWLCIASYSKPKYIQYENCLTVFAYSHSRPASYARFTSFTITFLILTLNVAKSNR